jgi:hypothetical protein
MNHSRIALFLVAGTLGVSPAMAQDYTFQLVQTQEVDLLNDSNNPSFFIGNNPSSIAFDGTDLYVGGFANFSAPIPGVQIVQIQDFLLGPGGRQFAVVEGSFAGSPTPVVNFRGWTGLDWDAERGLLGTVDFGNTGFSNQIRVFNYKPSTAGGFLRSLNLKAQSIDLRGIAGPSWDRGFNGQGFGSDGAIVAAVLDPFTGPAEEKNGPFGHILPAEPGLSDPIPSLDSIFGVAYFPPSGPALIQPDTSTLWRDMDVDPNTGDMAARAANILIIGARASNGQTPARISVGTEEAPFVSGQNVAILHGLDGGDLVIYNNRPITDGGQTFDGAVRLVTKSGSPVTLNIVDGSGAPVALPPGVGYYDFAWHEASQTLCILDFAARDVYVLRPFSEPTCPCDSAANINCDGQLNFFDVSAFIQLYNAQDPIADFNNDGLFNFFDVSSFIGVFNQGCP